ncbi:hypothetical protein, partial [Calidifontibacter terrae]
ASRGPGARSASSARHQARPDWLGAAFGRAQSFEEGMARIGGVFRVSFHYLNYQDSTPEAFHYLHYVHYNEEVRPGTNRKDITMRTTKGVQALTLPPELYVTSVQGVHVWCCGICGATGVPAVSHDAAELLGVAHIDFEHPQEAGR